MARRRDDDIFKKLKKETPIVKRKEISPLSSRDFKPRRSSFDIEIEKKAQQRRTNQPGRTSPELGVSSSRKKTVYRGREKKGASLADSYRRSRQQTPPESKDGPRIFTEEAQQHKTAPEHTAPQAPVRKTAAPARRTDERLKPPIPAHRPDMPADPAAGTVYRPVRPKTEPARTRARYETDTASQGQLDFRHELKFYINYHDYIVLRNALKALLSPDVYTGADNTYHIRSLYFDDVYESAVQEKMAGIAERSKYRIRIYNYSDDVIRFEKKTKTGQYVAKKSFMLSRTEYDQIIAGNYDFLRDRQEELASEIYHELKSKMLRPRVFVDYTREAYVSPIENVRITFDKDLKGGLRLADIFDPDTPVMPMLETGMMVLEVKFNRFLPEVIRCVLNSINASGRSAISKYIICRKFD